MTETKKTLAIMMTRWQEICIIIALSIMGLIAIGFSSITKPNPSLDFTDFLFLVFAVIVVLISTILSYGFLRTLYLEGTKEQPPAFLFRTGMKFFWRILKFQILCGFVILPFVLIGGAISSIENLQVPSWFLPLFSIVPQLIIIKPLLLMPALIIVMDTDIYECWKFMGKYNLSKARELITLFCGLLMFGFLWSLLIPEKEGDDELQNIVPIIPFIVNQIIGLVISITAVRFVAYCNTVHDSNAEQLGETLGGGSFEE